MGPEKRHHRLDEGAHHAERPDDGMGRVLRVELRVVGEETDLGDDDDEGRQGQNDREGHGGLVEPEPKVLPARLHVPPRLLVVPCHNLKGIKKILGKQPAQ